MVRALIAVPPMPAPKMPMARPRRSGGNQALTNGTPTANAVPAMPRKKPPTSSSGVGVEGEEADEEHRNDGRRGDEREHHPPAVAVGQGAHDDPAQRADDHRHGDQERHVGLGQLAERPRVAEHRPEGAEQRPGPEVHGEAEGGERQHQPAAVRPATALRSWHALCHRCRPSRSSAFRRGLRSSTRPAGQPLRRTGARRVLDAEVPTAETARRAPVRRPGPSPTWKLT